ncbi:hypothetical protein [Algibacter pacificus]|uniref:hypothetical protein n=1 Tax=Algibacter pacificus TaxID=2599389 RepID=UPI0011C73DF4|nr:hypothetical protein [Algibacter pacificus]
MKEQVKTSKNSKTIGIIVGIISAVFSYYFVKKVLLKTDIETELKSAAIELNKQTPLFIDEFSRLDSASTKGKTNFIYHYALIGIEKSEVNIDTVNKYIRPGIIENVTNSPELKFYRDHNITMDYRYYDENGDFVMEISVTPEHYRK